MTLDPRWTVLAAALLLAIGGALAAPPAKVPGASSEGTAGEAAAQAYCEQNRARFAAHATVITPEQTAAALAEGELEGPRARQPRWLSEGDEWTLPARFVAPE